MLLRGLVCQALATDQVDEPANDISSARRQPEAHGEAARDVPNDLALNATDLILNMDDNALADGTRLGTEQRQTGARGIGHCAHVLAAVGQHVAARHRHFEAWLIPLVRGRTERLAHGSCAPSLGPI